MHSSLNDIIHRALSDAKIPAHLEPSGVARADGKRQDGISMVPWKGESSLFGRQHAGTPWHHHISPLQKEGEVSEEEEVFLTGN